MPASESNFANVYVNDTLLGLYSNVEAVNNEFLEKHFTTADNVLVKGNPETVDLYRREFKFKPNARHGFFSIYLTLFYAVGLWLDCFV